MRKCWLFLSTCSSRDNYERQFSRIMTVIMREDMDSDSAFLLSVELFYPSFLDMILYSLKSRSDKLFV